VVKVVPLENFAIAALNKAFPTRRVVFFGVAAGTHSEPPNPLTSTGIFASAWCCCAPYEGAAYGAGSSKTFHWAMTA
jgi:hypothetical protein